VKLRLVSVGRSGDDPADQLAADYIRRIRKFVPIEAVEVRAATGRAQAGASRAERETASALAALGLSDRLVTLDVRGRALDSPAFARWLDAALAKGPPVAFLVGGADGLAEPARARAELVLSLSPLTLPHALARAVLAEQIYRAFSILRGTPYHR
jgi:23S rRNA (pseudouridine1915-N3)-methyltransferase